MVNKKGETRLHLALFTGALVLEENSTRGSQNNLSDPPWYPHRKEKKKINVYNKACSAASEKGEGEWLLGGEKSRSAPEHGCVNAVGKSAAPDFLARF